MADVIKKSTNKFSKGLVMDFSPENTKNEVLTHALNATLLTFNGNELSLQNDMGNARVETAFLPEGYMPVGTCEYGGIIYIVSYNPLEDKSQIGCFPSPEQNVSNDELGVSDAIVSRDIFQLFNADGKPTGDLVNTSQYVLLKNDSLNPGDKFLVCSDNGIYDQKLQDLWVKTTDAYSLVEHPIIALNIVSIEDSGKITYLNSDIRQYEVNVGEDKTFKYHILGSDQEEFNQENVDIDSYRNVLSSGYSVFKSKTSGKLAILAELIMIDSYSVTHRIEPSKDIYGDNLSGSFDVIISTDITPTVNASNYLQVPKLRYYHLQKSQGKLQVAENKTINLFSYKDGKHSLNDYFLDTLLSQVYEPTTDSDKLDLTQKINNGQYNFHKPDTYHGRLQMYTDKPLNPDGVYTKLIAHKFHRLSVTQLYDKNGVSNIGYFNSDLNAKFYVYQEDSDLQEYPKNTPIDESYVYYVQTTVDTYIDVCRDAENYQDQGVQLYKQTSLLSEAKTDIILDKSIEKFVSRQKHIYTKIDNNDPPVGVTLWVKSGDDYLEHTLSTLDPNVDYYKSEPVQVLESIGFDVNPDNYKNRTLYYYASVKRYQVATQEDLAIYWDFETYPKQSEAPYGSPITLFYKHSDTSYTEATEEQLRNADSSGIQLYYKTDYIRVQNLVDFKDEQGQLFVTVPNDAILPPSKFTPDASKNYINSYEKPVGINEPETGYPKDDPIYLYTFAEFIPDPNYLDLGYEDVKLASIKLPETVFSNGLDLPFIYDYSIVPCMNYGKLQHLAISNTVDFGKLHAFDQSTFTTWKYHIDNNQLRLTFGAEVFDTFETDKVDALVLEFYDVWGFAGSLEISDKKSYSGMFTKVIPLNSLGALSNKRIVGNSYSSSFKRNINIKEVYDENSNLSFEFSGKRVNFVNQEQGWKYEDGTSFNDNDCGTLYTNIVYGVKAYFRRTKGEQYEFINKGEDFQFLLYTLPIYNDFYYTTNNFKALENPQLELLLTYKMKDESSKQPFTLSVQEDGETIPKIINGYCNTDRNFVTDYQAGKLSGVSILNLTKYYKFTGTTQLYLEIGLKKEYSDFNLFYSKDLNKYYQCDLQLISDDVPERTYTVSTGDGISTTLTQSLNYFNKDDVVIDESVNNLGFGESYARTKPITSNFDQYNFLTKDDGIPIELNYQFVVGYPVSISEIHTTEIPATTICALLHQDSNSKYNYHDFGIYQQTQGDDTLYLPSGMFYNGGTAYEEIFGTCRLMNNKVWEAMTTQCQIENTVKTSATDIKTHCKLNSGDPLKQMVTHIGKLAFCQPHAHGMSSGDNGVNLYESDGAFFGIAPDYGGYKMRDEGWFGDDEWDNTYGRIPRTYLNSYPRYNMSLNTKNAFNYYSEFISTLEYDTVSGRIWGYEKEENYGPNQNGAPIKTMRAYTGFTASEVEQFYSKLVTTLKSIYVYNPDYNSLPVNVGSVSVSDNKPRFTSNIVNNRSQLNFDSGKSLNDYIYLGPISFANYIKYMEQHSEDVNGNKFTVYKDGSPIPQLQLKPNFTYCGTDVNCYLVSSLTYNMPTPSELEQELAFKATSSTVIKHHDGSVETISGTVDKKALYGYHQESKKLIQLDVSNYEINNKGELTIKDSAVPNNQDQIVKVTQTSKYSDINPDTHKYVVRSEYNLARFRGTSLTINDLDYDYSTDHRLFVKNNTTTNDTTYRCVIFYRSTSDKNSWVKWDTEYKNGLHLQVGPCFTSNNLN